MLTIEQVDPLNTFYSQPDFLVGPWRIKWTGFKMSTPPDRSTRLVGQWVAYPVNDSIDQRYFYASSPGQQGIYNKGDFFSIEGGEAVEEDDFALPQDQLYGKAGRLRQDALNRLFKLMRASSAEGLNG